MEAKDLTKEFPASPRETLGGFIIAKRALDKCQATVKETNGEYHFNCPLDQIFFTFTGISADDFKSKAAELSVDQMGEWIKENSQVTDIKEIVAFNNKYKDIRLSDMDVELQVYMEKYIPECLPQASIVRVWFDVYDIEEKRIKPF